MIKKKNLVRHFIGLLWTKPTPFAEKVIYFDLFILINI